MGMVCESTGCIPVEHLEEITNRDCVFQVPDSVGQTGVGGVAAAKEKWATAVEPPLPSFSRLTQESMTTIGVEFLFFGFFSTMASFFFFLFCSPLGIPMVEEKLAPATIEATGTDLVSLWVSFCFNPRPRLFFNENASFGTSSRSYLLK